MINLKKLKKQGGATLDAKGNPFTPKTGYMVSLMGYESKLSLSDKSLKSTLRERLKRYTDIVKDYEKRTALNVKLGLWIDNGELYFDVSQYVTERELALYLGKAREQKAIFDFNKKETIYI